MSQGRKAAPTPSLFVYVDEERLYAHIPKHEFYEQLGRIVDLEFVRELTAPLYAHRLGRPSLDPVVFFKAMLVGFFENIIADTQLEFRLADSLLLRRFLGYSIEERTPDESTLRKTRQKMPEEVFQLVFEQVLVQCQAHGLLGGRALGVDSTVVDANASLDSLTHRELGCTYEQYVLAVRRQDEPEAGRGEAKKADRKRAGKGNNRVWRSPTDPDARVMVHADKHTHLSYRVEAVVDLETGAIVSAGAAPADQSDQDLCLPRVDQAIETLTELGEEPLALVADKGYHCAENLRGIAERGLIPLVTAPRRATGPEGFTRDDFVYDAASDTFQCPAGAQLVCTGQSHGRRRYQAARKVCGECEHWGTCTKNKAGRQILVSPDEALVEANRERVYSEAARPLMMIRRQRGERPSGYFKQYGGMARMNGRGLAYAEKKTLLAAVGWNLLLMVKQAMREAAEGAEALLWGVVEALSAALWGVLTGPGRVERREAAEPRWRCRRWPGTAAKWALSGGC